MIGLRSIAMVILAGAAQLVAAQHVVSTDGQRIVISVGSRDGVKNGKTGKLCTAEIVGGHVIENCSALFTVVSTLERRAIVRVTKGVGRDARPGYLVKFDQKLVAEEEMPQEKRKTSQPPSRPRTGKEDDPADRAFSEADRAFQSGDCRGALERYEVILQRYGQHRKADLAATRAEVCRAKLVQIGLPPTVSTPGEDGMLPEPPVPTVALPPAAVLPLAAIEAETFAATAEKLLQDGKPVEARRAATEALRKDSTNPRAHAIIRGINAKSVRSRFNGPNAVAVVSNSSCYVADSGNNAIRKIAAGQTSTVAGVAGQFGGTDGPLARARFNEPTGVAAGSDGSIYVADRYNASIRRIAPDGSVHTVAGRIGSPGFVDGLGTQARFNEPRRLVVDPDGTIYVADTGNHAVRKLGLTGEVVTVARTGVNDRMDPEGMAIDPAGGLIVADTWAHVIRHIDANGNIRVIAGVVGSAGGNDGAAAAARFNSPADVAMAPDGTIYIADAGNHVIRRLVGGAVSTIAGRSGVSGSNDGTASAARFSQPAGLALDARGDLWIADRGNQTIRFLSDGFVSTAAGLAADAGSSDGTN